MRPYLTALATLLGVTLLYQGLVQRGLIGDETAPLEPGAAELLIAAAAAMGLAAVTVRVHAGLAAVEMALAGVVVMSIAGPDHRYLLAYGGVALVLAVFAAIAAMSPPERAGPRAARHDAQAAIAEHTDAGSDPAPSPAVAAEDPPSQAARPDPDAAQRALLRVADARGRQAAARQARRGWRAEPAPRREPPETPEPPPAQDAGIPPPGHIPDRSGGHAADTA